MNTPCEGGPIGGGSRFGTGMGLISSWVFLFVLLTPSTCPVFGFVFALVMKSYNSKPGLCVNWSSFRFLFTVTWENFLAALRNLWVFHIWRLWFIRDCVVLTELSGSRHKVGLFANKIWLSNCCLSSFPKSTLSSTKLLMSARRLYRIPKT